MSQPQQQAPKRFRVALSFPGEHRERVEKIAEALRQRLGNEKVLYDKWYGPEFARPNLDLYLSKLYHDDSDLIAIFLSKEYGEKEWTNEESRVWRDIRHHKDDGRLMYLRFDEAAVPGVYAIDGYLGIREMDDAQVAAAILTRLGEKLPGPAIRAFTSKLPAVNPKLIGRDAELAFLDRAWADPATNVVQVVAAGGTGKTALVDKWFRKHLRAHTRITAHRRS
jgi:TIR domain